VNTETLVATVPDQTDTSSTNLGKPLKDRGTLKALQQKGVKIKGYRETDGAGRTISYESTTNY